MTRFQSILFDRRDRADVEDPEEPAIFADLNLDQVLESMIAGLEEYDLKPFFYAPLRDVAAVRYRHEVLRDLEKRAVFESVAAFAQRMRTMREYLERAEKLHYPYQKQRWFLDAADIYREAVRTLAEELMALDVASAGLQAFREYLARYMESDHFRSLAADTEQLKDALASVSYTVQIRGARVTVSTYDGEADYSAQVQDTFSKFKQGAVQDYRAKLPDWVEMNHIQARILELVARLHPDVFSSLSEYCARHVDYLDSTVRAFDREVQFYLAYLKFIARFKSAGLPFCYPRVSGRSKNISADEAFDLALANRLVPEGSEVVRNSLSLEDPERIFVVTGPNQGGKTTFARMFGQLHYLASLGLPVPAKDARLFLPDRVFTHFEKEEDIATLRGKLEDDLLRIRDILQHATGNSIIVMNESFTSTTLDDAVFLGTEVMNRIIDVGSLAVCVTFVDELASLGDATVSMVSTVVPDNPAERTYKIVRKPADGLAYAAAIAEKYSLTYDSLRKRVAR